MADEEQFSLCWNNFNTNLSAGFHESLCRGDLVDVTLAAEGQLVKAHRLVLSVCSPYFRKMFTQMPANQHAFVFLKDVSSSALKDLIQFMYCGEVNVKQEALPAFISTAEALQIKGLTESNDGTVTAQGSSSPTKEGNVSTPLPDQSSLRPRSTRIVASRPQAFKIESEGSSDEKQTVTLVQTTQPSKRSSRQSITVAPKRIKMSQSQESADPLDDPEHEIVTPQHLKVTEATEFIDLPIEGTQLNPKTEPEYVEDTQEIETEQDDDQYVEDVTYGEEKYDESYFTEGDDKAGVSGFSETYATEGDQSNTDAQEMSIFIPKLKCNIMRQQWDQKRFFAMAKHFNLNALTQKESHGIA
ncbi:CLUMA_CG005563, isoform X [Clunio marinus]|uniref:CLUMA_CG005563, isoform X n=1 Tax=Clunio marinus TaxID=568069 RepID=A0A1J1HV58_9DIPT|nr:CLUMA_CG005563, isoform X [Clunio marinus]